MELVEGRIYKLLDSFDNLYGRFDAGTPIIYKGEKWSGANGTIAVQCFETKVSGKPISFIEYEDKIEEIMSCFDTGDLVECTRDFGVNRIGDQFIYLGMRDTVYAKLAPKSRPTDHTNNQPIDGLKKVEETMNGKNIKRGHFIIGTVHKTTGAVSFAAQPKVHYDEDSAVAEARRLAVTCPEKKFMVVEVKAIARTTDVVVE